MPAPRLVDGRLLVTVAGVSGRPHPPGTPVRAVAVGAGRTADAWIAGEWVPLRWFEWAPGPAPTAS